MEQGGGNWELHAERGKQSESRTLLSTLLNKTDSGCSEGDPMCKLFSQTSASSKLECVEEIKE